MCNKGSIFPPWYATKSSDYLADVNKYCATAIPTYVWTQHPHWVVVGAGLNKQTKKPHEPQMHTEVLRYLRMLDHSEGQVTVSWMLKIN